MSCISARVCIPSEKRVVLMRCEDSTNEMLEDVLAGMTQKQLVATVLGVCFLDTEIVLALNCTGFLAYCFALAAAIGNVQPPRFYRCSITHLRFMPYVSLARYTSRAQMYKEAPAIISKFAPFVDTEVILEDYRLVSDE